LTAIHDNKADPTFTTCARAGWSNISAAAAMSDAHWLSESGELLTTDAKGLSFWTPGKWTIDRRLAWPETATTWQVRGLAPDHRTAWIQPPGGSLRLLDLVSNTDYAILEQPLSFAGNDACFDTIDQRVFTAADGAVLMWSLAELRYELADLGLDWADEHPAQGFAPAVRGQRFDPR